MLKKSALTLAIAASLPIVLTTEVLAQTVTEKPTDTQTVEGVVVKDSFFGIGAQSAMKLDIPIRDTPFSVSAYTESFMKSIETSNVSDLFKYMTGVTRAGATAFDMSIRGFKTGANDRNAIMVDGLPGLSGRFASPPTVATDHVEVVRGPASVLYGQAQPGGFVNIITKKPQADASIDIGMKGTAYIGNKLKFRDAKGYSLELDATGPINGNNQFLYRIIGEKTDRDLFRDNTYIHSDYIAPSVTWILGPSTTATFLGEYRRTTTSYDNGLVPPARDIKRVAALTTVYQSPSDYQTETGKTASIAVNHQFGNKVKWNFSARTVQTDDTASGFDNVALRADLVTLQMRARGQENGRKSNFFDNNFIIPFKFAFIDNQLIAGVNGGFDTSQLNRTQFFNGAICTAAVIAARQCIDTNLYNPVYNFPALSTLPRVNTGTQNLTERYTKSEALGGYIADLMTLSEQWKVNLGVRYTKDTQFISTVILVSTATLPDTRKKASKSLPLAGILFQPNKEWSFYSSYSASYSPAPSNAIDTRGLNPFLPESATQVEIGVKGDFMRGKIQPTLAFFDIKKKDVLTTFACPLGTCTQQIGGERSKGVEFEVDLRPVKNWQVAFGVSHITATVTESSDLAQIGARLANSAKDQAHMWSRYNWTDGPFKGLGFGLGVSKTSDRAGNLPTTANKNVIDLPAYTLVDLALYYARDKYDITFKIANVTDKLFYESTGATADVQVQAGAPRNMTLSFRYHF